MAQDFLDVPLLEVTGPAGQPSGYGLYSVTPPTDATDVHARGGVRWLDEVGGTAAAFAIDCPPTFTLPTEGEPVWVESPAFGVAAGLALEHPLGVGLAQVQRLARTRLGLQESFAVERAYWTGVAGGDPTGAPHLAAATGAQVLSATPVSVARGLGMLEEAIGLFTGAIGVIHGARHMVGSFPDLTEKGGRLTTKVGTQVALGTGYPGTGPDGTRAAGVSWLYATGPVLVLRSPVIDVPSEPWMAFDRATDRTAVHAVRFVSVGHAAGLAAVPVNLA
jgi:hypothetical protein